MTEVALLFGDHISHDFVELSTLLGEEEFSSSNASRAFEDTISQGVEMRHYETLPEFNFYRPTDGLSKGVVATNDTVNDSDYLSERHQIEPACVSPTPSTTILDQMTAVPFLSLPDVKGTATDAVQSPSSTSRKRKGHESLEDEPVECTRSNTKQKDRRREKNREHAKKSRSKKKDLTKQLEETVLMLKRENQRLKDFVNGKIASTEADTEKMIKDRIVTPTDRFIDGLKKPSNRILSNSAISYLNSLGADFAKR